MSRKLSVTTAGREEEVKNEEKRVRDRAMKIRNESQQVE